MFYPENVSSIIPLKADLFDVIIFDEASQIFIENSIPTIFRGKSVAIAGDRKQLKPTTTFMKRYIGNENFEDMSLTTGEESVANAKWHTSEASPVFEKDEDGTVWWVRNKAAKLAL